MKNVALKLLEVKDCVKLQLNYRSNNKQSHRALLSERVKLRFIRNEVHLVVVQVCEEKGEIFSLTATNREEKSINDNYGNNQLLWISLSI